ncbi:MAG: DNA polymerase III subunit gamma/tau [Bacilli bacterium]
MNNKVLYRKYRPNKFDEIVGQDAILKTIRSSLKNNKVAHAYLFCGPRGTGKTSLAKLIAKTVNCIKYPIDNPCGECNNCKRIANNEDQDIIEIDAASNNGVDEIRDIKEKVSFFPSASLYKIYIIDEVHMLTTGAFNALLKTLEEPPGHVIFILATTEPYRLPATIISRCQRFDLKRITVDKIVEKLNEICKKEKIKIDKNVFTEIALLSEGGLRDAINMLDQLLAYSERKITIDDVNLLSGRISNKELSNLFMCIIDNKVKDSLDLINELIENGRDIVKMSENMMRFLKDVLLVSMGCNTTNIDIDEKFKTIIDKEYIYYVIDEINKTMINMKNSNNPKLLLELLVLKMIDKYNENKIPDDIENEEKKIEIKREKMDLRCDDKEIKITQNNKATAEKEIDINYEKLLELKKIRINNALATANKDFLSKLKERWIELSTYSTDLSFGPIAGLLLDGNIRVVSEGNIIISYAYPSMADRINTELLKAEKMLNKLLKEKFKIIAISDEEWKEVKKKYVEKIKNKQKYDLLDENIDICKDIYIKNKSSKQKKVVKDAIDLFGENIIEIR